MSRHRFAVTLLCVVLVVVTVASSAGAEYAWVLRAEQRRSSAAASASFGEQLAQSAIGSHEAGARTHCPDEREQPLDVGSRAWGGGRNICELTQWKFQCDRDVVKTVDGDRFFTALDFSDELPAQPGASAEMLLAQSALLALRA
jgi:hypothetical protein